ncbi:hypothetical protein Q1W73_09290 [Asticcacaulis sp. ZE23SCel15]|uniref:hypothetical protein n=1 Tax=Asticcacaulis sp. ZE23SCel15 TaxID=3059027 RepID=UPI00265E8100|nr:hypothetical protein [Asticcacaulis sp. ZE23SCel15]WKL55899.1 hypothetical protein Q1W73_09290 [Asticcacaulis sp. ZE23SCel15]
MRIEIERGPTEDVATLEHVLSDTKSYLAGVTYHSFTPIISETNAERKAYWIVGLNLSRTPDRSVYSVIRFPYEQTFNKGSETEIEYLKLDCYDLSVARSAVASFDPANVDKNIPDELSPEAGECEFNSLKEAYNLTGLMFKKYDQIKHFDGAPQPKWQKLRVTAS